MKTTAVEWLALYIKRITTLNCDEVIERAKQMEREQIMDAYKQGESDGYKQFIINIDKKYQSAEQYYNETYNNNDKNSS